MEEEGWDEDKLIDYYEAISRWSDAIDKHLISAKQVAEIINERTGAQMKW